MIGIHVETRMLHHAHASGHLMSDRKVQVSKFLSLVLRHAPETISLELDDHGWVDVDELARAAALHGTTISREQLDEVVYTNDKQRFCFSGDGERIRASQGLARG